MASWLESALVSADGDKLMGSPPKQELEVHAKGRLQQRTDIRDLSRDGMIRLAATSAGGRKWKTSFCREDSSSGVLAPAGSPHVMRPREMGWIMDGSFFLCAVPYPPGPVLPTLEAWSSLWSWDSDHLGYLCDHMLGTNVVSTYHARS